MPWCGAPEGKPATPTPPVEPLESPPRPRQPSPLQDIAEEDVIFDEEDDERGTIQPLGVRLIKKKHRNVQSPSPTLSVKTGSRKSQRPRATVTTNTSGEGSFPSAGGGRMQAEQGSIADLQKHHNRYLRNRRHTLANVR